MSTHILSDVERVCDRVAIVNLGHLVVEGPIDELLDRYAQPIYEIEPEPGRTTLLATRIADSLRPLPWVSDVSVETGKIRVFVSEPSRRATHCFRQSPQLEIPLLRFERARPSLEDVFMRLLTEQSQTRVAPQIDIPVTGLDGRGRQ